MSGSSKTLNTLNGPEALRPGSLTKPDQGGELPPLTLLQRRFCDEYIVDHNATAAYLRVIGRPSTAARQIAHELLHKPHVAARIAELEAPRIEPTPAAEAPDPAAEANPEYWNTRVPLPKGNPLEAEWAERAYTQRLDAARSSRSDRPAGSVCEYNPLDHL